MFHTLQFYDSCYCKRLRILRSLKIFFIRQMRQPADCKVSVCKVAFRKQFEHGFQSSLTCCDKPFKAVLLTRRMTSPTSIRPLSAAGCPGNSFFTLTTLGFTGSCGRFSSLQKLNPKPEVFFNSFTSNTLSVEGKQIQNHKMSLIRWKPRWKVINLFPFKIQLYFGFSS